MVDVENGESKTAEDGGDEAECLTGVDEAGRAGARGKGSSM
jgi:hypothetical protein